MNETVGALIIGGNLNGLSIARSLGRRGVPVWVATQPNVKLASFSRYTQRTLPWPNGDDESQIVFLLDLAERHRLDRWVLYPTSDESAALLSKYCNVLSHQFRVSTPSWDILRWAYDKRLTYQLAAEQQVDCPLTFYPGREVDINLDALQFPVILKPATHAILSKFTADKAWPAANRGEFLARYREALAMIPPDLILVQERIPGGGESQFSYAALCRDGVPIASLTARRTRQYPVDFGYSSSMVEIFDVPEIVASSERLLSAIRYTGLVEVEYKLDARNGRYKLLDINPRIWTWSTLGARAGVDFPYLLWQMMMDKPIQRKTAGVGVRWVRMSTDIPAAIQEMLRRRLGFMEYLSSLRSPIEFALMAADDPLPGLLELPMFVYKHLYNGFRGLREGAPMKPERAKG
ncbi:MAG TPA: ATP-grasp domain-containing protein [Candidatus Acidoferrales bacterium]|nr:ATP-grasp domain-containing protein [Candidatus Acidoferrales bacterium]